MKEALFYNGANKGAVKCFLCPHNCHISDGGTGVCKVRKNQEGVLNSLVYGHPVSSSMDPIEKKPLFHFQPGSETFSLATFGCNLKCSFCQNHTISQCPSDNHMMFQNSTSSKEVTPENIVKEAIRENAKSISFTYTEPTIFFEYALEISKLAISNGLKTIFVSNGYINPDPIRLISQYLSAINIDLKCFSDETYRKVMKGSLLPVLTAIKEYYKSGVWVEITTLLITDLNDSEEEVGSIAEFIASVSCDIPWHISRYHPRYKMRERKSTEVESIAKARETGKKAGLKYVYSGNLFGDDGESTYCPSCSKKLINRKGYAILENLLEKGSCPECQAKISGHWE